MFVLGRPAVSSRLLVAAALVLLAVGAWWGAAVPAQAATHEITVTRDVYDPASRTVHVGDTVVWTWEESGGSVTADDGSFDSHPDCPEEGPFGCGVVGETFEVTFRKAGTFAYHAKGEFARAEGEVIVEPVPPKPTPTPSETSPSPTPSETSPTESEPEPSPEPTTSEPEPSPEPTTSSPAPPPSPTETETETATPVEVSTPSPTPSPTPEPTPTEESPVPVPAPSFEDFPEAREPEAASDDDVEGTVAIGGTDDGDPSRVVWGVVGGASVLGTLGAFGRRVLFADPWDA